jgi:signal transduction histidine kinase
MAAELRGVYLDHVTSASVVDLRTAPAALWAARSWRATAHALVGLPVGVLGFALICGLPIGAAYCAVWSLLYASPGDWPLTTAFVLLTVVAPVPALWSVRGLTALQRRRFRALLGVEIPPLPRSGEPPRRFHDSPPRSGEPLRGSREPLRRSREPLRGSREPLPSNGDPLPRSGDALPGLGEPPPRSGGALPRRSSDPLPARFARVVRAVSTWRQIGYHVLALFIGVAGAALTAVVWSAGIGLGAALPLQAVGLWVGDGRWAVTVPAGVLAVVALLAAPWVARGVARVDTAAARALLGPSRSEELSQRVESLARSRADVIAATDAERRRIERDLHDGAQQRLVSLAMNLGMARVNLADTTGPAWQVIEAAHEEATQALAELREFVRGLHPAVLDDRGLDAALSGIVARVPLPVRLAVSVPTRCPPVIEAIAYFVVSEALTNITKHADATCAEVTVDRTADRLRVVVTDDGRGGATTDNRSGTTTDDRSGTTNDSRSDATTDDGRRGTTTDNTRSGATTDSWICSTTTDNPSGTTPDDGRRGAVADNQSGTTNDSRSGAASDGPDRGVAGGGGTGLRGLAQRAASVDGTFELHSPAGGPTTITVELPCAW